MVKAFKSVWIFFLKGTCFTQWTMLKTNIKNNKRMKNVIGTGKVCEVTKQKVGNDTNCLKVNQIKDFNFYFKELNITQ